MKRNNKKGFTIVELVIVIAVIAILAAVLIPTFANLTKKAQVANDTAVARNMNNALAQYSATNGAPESFEEVLAAIEEAGYILGNLNAKASGNLYGWDKTNNQIVYINAEGGVVYQNTDFVKEDLQFIITDSSVVVPEGFASTVVDMTKPDGPKAFVQAINSGVKEIKIDTDMTTNSTARVPEDTTITIDLNGKTLATSERDTNGSHHYAFDVHGTVVFENGTVDARGIQIYEGGKVVIGEGATVNAVDDNGGACFWIYGGELVIDGGTFKAVAGDNITADRDHEPGVINNNGGKVTINAGTFEAYSACYAITNNSGEMIINGGTFKASRGVVAVTGGTVTINGGTFETTAGADAHVVYVYNGTTTINAGTFTHGGTTTTWYDVSGTGSLTVKSGVVVGDTTIAEDTKFVK